MKHPTNTVSPPRIGLWSLPPWRCLMYVLTWTIPLFIEKWRLPLSDFPVLVVAIILLCSCIHVDVNTCTQLYNLLCKTFIILISSKTMSYPFSRVFSFTKIQLRPTPWRMQLEFHLRNLSFMSAEHDVKPGHSAGRSITKRHAVSNKLSRWDASVTHLISLPILRVHSSRRCSCSQLHSSLTLPSFNLYKDGCPRFNMLLSLL